jgi:hypothetical protein
MFSNIDEYINLPKEERQLHLRLNEPCIEIGGNSKEFRALLAHHVKTTIPQNRHTVHLCHACHNAKCSNPSHLYWGTCADNSQDAYRNGRLSIWEYSVKKYGLEEAHRRKQRAAQNNGRKK